jgi:tRNA nucleotidyltransferase (CCA-adding enzyme)
MLRALRFEQRFGFRVEQRTLELIQEARPLLAKVSGDRLRHELDHILEEAGAVAMLSRLNELDMLSAIHPDLAWDGWLAEKVGTSAGRLPEAEWGITPEVKGLQVKSRLAYILWLIRLSGQQARRTVNRLKLPRTLADEILAARRLRHNLDTLRGASPSEVVSRLSDLPALALYAVFVASDDDTLREILRMFAFRWRHLHPNIDGHDLRARGVPPGPIYREILESLRAAWLDGKINSPEQEVELLEKLLTAKGIKERG